MAQGPTAALLIRPPLPDPSVRHVVVQDAVDSQPFYREAMRRRIPVPSIFMVDSLEGYVSALEHGSIGDVSVFIFTPMIVTRLVN